MDCDEGGKLVESVVHKSLLQRTQFVQLYSLFPATAALLSLYENMQFLLALRVYSLL